MQTQKAIIVSGGSRGLGQAVVKECLANGDYVATFSRTATPFIEQMQRHDPEAGRFYWQQVDGTDADAIRGFVRNVAARFRRIDVLVNNAGMAVEGILPTMRPAEIDSAIDLNLRGAIYLIHACSRYMLQQSSGSIVNVSSINAIRGHSGVAVYSATKAALDGLTRSLAREFGSKNIRINSVAPGYFESDMVAHLSQEARKRIIRRTPLGRLGTVEDVAKLILFLASSQASFITGQTLAVDGGITC
jgi:3-oxoacyl-[acyl-carrier protein] reductase